jgi:alpha-L-rhamnosidase
MFNLFFSCNNTSSKFKSETKLISPISFKDYNSTRFYDFGESYFSTIIIKANVQKFDSIYLNFGDLLNKDKRLDTLLLNYTNKSTKIYLYPNKKYYNIFESYDNKLFRPYEVKINDNIDKLTPIRYVEVNNFLNNSNIKELNIYQKKYHNKFNDSLSYFNSSDTILNQLWKLCKHTVKATNFTTTYIDGDRERQPYEGDSYINLLSHVQVDTSFTTAKNTLEYLIKHPTWPTEYNLLIPQIFYTYALYSGDILLLSKYYNILKTKTLIDLENKDGIISTKFGKISIILQWNLGYRNYKNFIKQAINYKQPLFYNLRDMVDWPQSSKLFDSINKRILLIKGENDYYDYKEFNTVINAYHYNSLVVMSKIAKILKKNEDSELFLIKSFKTKKSFNKYFFNSKTKIYVDGFRSEHSSSHANIYPLKFGLVDNSRKNSVINFVKDRGMTCSPFTAQFLLDALLENNEIDFAMKLLNGNSNRNWKNMIDLGANMTFESWDFKFNPEMDMSHPWSTAPLNIINRRIWGIEPDEVGFKSFIFKPNFGELKFSNISIPTIYGNIEGEYKNTNNYKSIILNFPKKIIGYLILNNKSTFTKIKLIQGKKIFL